MDVKEILTVLSEADGISGYEGTLALKVEQYFRTLCAEVYNDELGNIFAVKKGVGDKKERLKIMLAAHMDEIGLVTTNIDENGFLRFSTIGGFDPRTLPGQEVVIHGKSKINGVIGVKPPHFISQKEKDTEKNKEIEIEKLFIDTGYSAKQLKNLARVGDTISINRGAYELAGECVSGKSFDDRAGVVVLLECLARLQALFHEVDVYAVATVQEEVGIRGAKVASYGLSPHIGIAIDVCHGNLPGVSEFETAEIGSGPSIGIGPNFHPAIVERLKQDAKSRRIPFQLDVSSEPTGTDARAIQIAGEGIPVGLLSLPLRYMHTSVELLSIKDINLTAELLACFVSGIDTEFMEGLACF